MAYFIIGGKERNKFTFTVGGVRENNEYEDTL